MDVKRTVVLSLGLLLLGGGALAWWWNRGYGEVSETGYALSMSLVSACNRQDSEHLAGIAALMEQKLASGELRPREGRWLGRIVSRAQAGHWQAASRSLRRLMHDQIRPAASLPQLD